LIIVHGATRKFFATLPTVLAVGTIYAEAIFSGVVMNEAEPLTVRKQNDATTSRNNAATG
jgi:hypothetical protein